MVPRFDILSIRPMGDGWNAPDEALESLWRRIVAEGKVEMLFYAGGIVSATDFIAYVKRPDILACVAIDTTARQPVALAWLTNLANGAAFPHFCVFGRPRRDAGRAILAHWESLLDPAGRPLIEVLIGVVPETHALSRRVMQILGFTAIGVIPRYCILARSGTRCGAVISHRVFERSAGDPPGGLPVV